MDMNPEYTVQLEDQSANKRFLIRLLSLDRKEQKTFCTSPMLEETIQKASEYGIEGNKILLADDGCEICDNESYIYYIVRGSKFMIAHSAAQWQPAERPLRNQLLHNCNNGSSELLFQESNLLDKKFRETPLTIQQLPPVVDIVEPTDCERRVIEPMAVNSLLAEERFRNIDVPWNQIPIDIRESLARGDPLDRKVHTLTKHIVHELRTISTNIPIRVLRMLAHRLVSRYPKSFQKAGQPSDLLPTVLNLALAMRHHNNYLNRSEKCVLQCCEPDTEWQDFVEDPTQ